MVVDPLAVVMEYLRNSPELAALCGDQIATHHRFGQDWDASRPALTVHLDGGEPDVYLPRQRLRLEVRVYAERADQAMEVYRSLVDLSRRTERAVVSGLGGTTVLYFLLPSSGPSLLFAPDLNLHMLVCFFSAQVGELSMGGL